MSKDEYSYIAWWFMYTQCYINLILPRAHKPHFTPFTCVYKTQCTINEIYTMDPALQICAICQNAPDVAFEPSESTVCEKCRTSQQLKMMQNENPGFLNTKRNKQNLLRCIYVPPGTKRVPLPICALYASIFASMLCKFKKKTSSFQMAMPTEKEMREFLCHEELMNKFFYWKWHPTAQIYYPTWKMCALTENGGFLIKLCKSMGWEVESCDLQYPPMEFSAFKRRLDDERNKDFVYLVTWHDISRNKFHATMVARTGGTKSTLQVIHNWGIAKLTSETFGKSYKVNRLVTLRLPKSAILEKLDTEIGTLGVKYLEQRKADPDLLSQVSTLCDEYSAHCDQA